MHETTHERDETVARAGEPLLNPVLYPNLEPVLPFSQEEFGEPAGFMQAVMP